MFAGFDIDIAIVVIFLVLTIVVGLGHGKSVKTIKDYALGGHGRLMNDLLTN